MPYVMKNGFMEFVSTEEKPKLTEKIKSKDNDGKAYSSGPLGQYVVEGGYLKLKSKSTPLTEDVFMQCLDCGKTLPEGAVRCSRCGSDVIDIRLPHDTLNGGESDVRQKKVPEPAPAPKKESVEATACARCEHPERLHGGSAPLGGCLFASGDFLCDCPGFVCFGMDEAAKKQESLGALTPAELEFVRTHSLAELLEAQNEMARRILRKFESSDDPSPFNFCKNCGGKVKKATASESEKWGQQGHCGKKCKDEWDGKHFGCCGKAKAIECDECDQAYECIEHGATHLGYHPKEGK